MDIITYIAISASIVVIYGFAVAAVLVIDRLIEYVTAEYGTAAEVSEAARPAFRKWFRFAN